MENNKGLGDDFGDLFLCISIRIGGGLVVYCAVMDLILDMRYTMGDTKAFCQSLDYRRFKAILDIYYLARF